MKKRFRAFLNENRARMRRFARGFITPHTGLQPSTPIVRMLTRRGKTRAKASWAKRKKAMFAQWHTGLTAAIPSSIQTIQFETRRRKARNVAVRRQERFAHFTLLHTGLQPPVGPSLHSRPRRTNLRYQRYRRLKRAKFPPGFFFTGLSPASVSGRPWLSVALMSSGYRRGGEW